MTPRRKKEEVVITGGKKTFDFRWVEKAGSKTVHATERRRTARILAGRNPFLKKDDGWDDDPRRI